MTRVLFTGGTVVTGDIAAPPVDSLLVDDGLVVAVGADADVRGVGHDEVVDLRGRSLLPAFRDAHAHPLHGGLNRLELDLTGLGTGGSSAIPSGGVSVQRATRQLGENLKKLAADALEAGVGDLEFDEATVRVAGTDRSITFADLAKRGAGDPDQLSGSAMFSSADGTFPNGTHLVEVEIDPSTGVTRLVNYVVVDDFGVTLNPLLLAGQVHGGAMQGIGQALMERAVYDTSDGQLVTGTFMDYALPRAADGAPITFETHNVPCVTNPLGVKGAGEAGAIGSCPAIMNAIIDGLWREYGIEHIDMPATPERVWMAISEAERRKPQ